MTIPGNQARGGSDLLGIVVATAAIVAGVAAVISLKDKAFIVATGIISGLVLAAVALHAIRRNDKTVGATVAAIAVAIMVATLVYGLIPSPTKVVGQQGQQSGSSTSQGSQTSRDTSAATPPVKKDLPIFQGSARIMTGQAIDLETAGPKAKIPGLFAAPEDIFVDRLAFAFDRDGYLVIHTGNPGDAKERCKELLESGQTRQATFALPNVWYCATTSEGRIALIRFGSTDVIGRVGAVVYQVWDN